jgi:hypothetical protein
MHSLHCACYIEGGIHVAFGILALAVTIGLTRRLISLLS